LYFIKKFQTDKNYIPIFIIPWEDISYFNLSQNMLQKGNINLARYYSDIALFLDSTNINYLLDRASFENVFEDEKSTVKYYLMIFKSIPIEKDFVFRKIYGVYISEIEKLINTGRIFEAKEKILFITKMCPNVYDDNLQKIFDAIKTINTENDLKVLINKYIVSSKIIYNTDNQAVFNRCVYNDEVSHPSKH